MGRPSGMATAKTKFGQERQAANNSWINNMSCLFANSWLAKLL
jgi:hypothetical protein